MPASTQELSSGEATQVGPLTIRATYAEHGERRFGFIREIDCLGYLVNRSQTVYFAGDTDLFPGMAEIGEHLDVAFLPVWGKWPTLGPGHTDPYQAAKAVQLLRPRGGDPDPLGNLLSGGIHPLAAQVFNRSTTPVFQIRR